MTFVFEVLVPFPFQKTFLQNWTKLLYSCFCISDTWKYCFWGPTGCPKKNFPFESRVPSQSGLPWSHKYWKFGKNFGKFRKILWKIQKNTPQNQDPGRKITFSDYALVTDTMVVLLYFREIFKRSCWKIRFFLIWPLLIPVDFGNDSLTHSVS